VPTVLRVRGSRFFFFSNDDRERMHIHVDSDDNAAKFWLEPVQLARSIGYSARELRQIREIITENLDNLRRRWNEYFNQ
jgi:hypothetical protein